MKVLDSQTPDGWEQATIRQKRRDLTEELYRRLGMLKSAHKKAEAKIRAEINEKREAIKRRAP